MASATLQNISLEGKRAAANSPFILSGSELTRAVEYGDVDAAVKDGGDGDIHLFLPATRRTTATKLQRKVRPLQNCLECCCFFLNLRQPHGNMMYDKRIVRGNTYALRTLPAVSILVLIDI